MTDYLRIRQILDNAVNGETFAAHGPFWRRMSRDQFVNASVFGRRLIAQRADGTFDPDESNLVKALEGRPPFGDDLTPPPAGAFWPRMPVGYPPVPAREIKEIRDWISAGCPETQPDASGWIDANGGGPQADPTIHNNFFRDFDNWAMFHATPDTQANINSFFAVADRYFELALGRTPEANWVNAISVPEVTRAVEALELQQRNTAIQHYGTPVPLLTLLDGFMRFGDNTLPDDPQRPLDVRHNMNGRTMWFFWAAFADACDRLSATTQIPADFWHGMSRGILIGLISDGLIRGRFTVNGFAATPAGQQAALQHVRQLAAQDLRNELTTRLVDSGIF